MFSTHQSCWCSAKFYYVPYHWDLALCAIALVISSGKHWAPSTETQSCSEQGWLRRQLNVKIGQYTDECFLLRATVCHHVHPSRHTHPIDVTSQWQDDWKSASVVNSSLVDDPTIRQPGLDLPRRYWSKINHFRTNPRSLCILPENVGLATSDKCQCGKRQTMFYIVNNGGEGHPPGCPLPTS